MKVFVIGGAGYVGSNLVHELVKKHEVIVIDNLSKGYNILPTDKVTFFNINIDKELNKIIEVFSKKDPDSVVIHLAGKKSIQESINNPDIYWDNNVIGTQNILYAMKKNNLNSIIFASTASVYGNFEGTSDENTKISLLSPYAETKFYEEEMIKSSGLNYTIFRFFNIAGAINKNLKEKNGNNLFSNIIESIENNKLITIYGDNHNTEDGTQIRDYVHVQDICSAIVLAIPKVSRQSLGTMNLSGFKKYSIKTIIEEVQNYKKIDVIVGQKREGDPSIMTGKSDLAKSVLDWESSLDIKKIIKSIIN